MKTRMNRRALLTYLLITIGSYSFAGCNNNEKGKSKEQAAQTSIVDENKIQAESSADDVVFKDKDGKTVSISSLKGKVVFINFWATWCPPCIQEMPSINELRKTFKDNKDMVFLMVDVDNKMEKSSAFMQKKGYDLPVFVPVGNIPSDYLGGAIPTTVILDKKGVLVARIEGGRDYGSPEIIERIRELLKK